MNVSLKSKEFQIVMYYCSVTYALVNVGSLSNINTLTLTLTLTLIMFLLSPLVFTL